MVDVGTQFPGFDLPDQDGSVHTLDEFVGARVVFFFYPKDDTSGCTVEACGFRDLASEFGKVRIVGISPDPPRSHRKFVDKFGLGLTLLSDVEHTLAEACGVWVEKSMYGRTYMGIERSTFLVNGNGIVEQVWRKVKPDAHAAAVLEYVR